MNALTQLGGILAISCLAAAATFAIKGPPVRKFLCDPATLKTGEVCLDQIPADQDILWIDARARKEWEEDPMPGSVLWNLDPHEDMQAFEAEVAMRILETPKAVVYCGDENCGISHQVAERIRALGLGAEVSVLKGGSRALREAGRLKSVR
jgi:rhodanese-related sulfurtransferase